VSAPPAAAPNAPARDGRGNGNSNGNGKGNGRGQDDRGKGNRKDIADDANDRGRPR
jgi:hypothetical protein